MPLNLKISKRYCVSLTFLKGSSSGISISAMGVISSHLETLMERNYLVAEKEKDDLHEQEDIFDNDEDDTITVSGQNCQNSLL